LGDDDQKNFINSCAAGPLILPFVQLKIFVRPTENRYTKPRLLTDLADDLFLV
jgi:hypothetical protein